MHTAPMVLQHVSALTASKSPRTKHCSRSKPRSKSLCVVRPRTHPVDVRRCLPSDKLVAGWIGTVNVSLGTSPVNDAKCGKQDSHIDKYGPCPGLSGHIGTGRILYRFLLPTHSRRRGSIDRPEAAKRCSHFLVVGFCKLEDTTTTRLHSDGGTDEAAWQISSTSSNHSESNQGKKVGDLRCFTHSFSFAFSLIFSVENRGNSRGVPS